MLVNCSFRAGFLAPRPAHSIVRIPRADPPSVALDGCGQAAAGWPVLELHCKPGLGSACDPGSASVPGTLQRARGAGGRAVCAAPARASR